MKKRLLSLLLVLVVVFSFSLSAFATDTGIDIIDDPLSYYFENQMLGVQKGTGVTLVCPKCDYKVVYTGGTLVTCPYDGEALVLADLAGVHAEKVPSGIGRKDLPGYSDNNVPDVSQSGQLHFYAPVTCWGITGSNSYRISSGTPELVRYNTKDCAGSSFSSESQYSSYVARAICAFTAPVSGTYYIYKDSLVADYYWRFSSSDEWKKQSLSFKATKSASFNKGEDGYVSVSTSVSVPLGFNAKGYGVDIYVSPLTSTINKQTNITINNDYSQTWNGNIYTDNSTNLTYIYPQYTTINEKNETVTNISNTPIIYNNETKQYYTYDQTTKNYYYITYNAQPTPSPSPTPAPTDKPGGSISTPETGKPGGDTGDTTGILAVLVEIRDNMIQGFLDIKAAFVAGFAELSANFTLAIENLNVNIQNIFNKKFPDQSTPETALPSPSPSPAPTDPPSPSPAPDPGKPDSGDKTNNFWTIIFPNGGGSEDGKKGIFWALVSLILALIAFFANLAVGVGYLFPFLPDGVVMTINTCLIVIFLFTIIKFIMRSK